MCTNPITIYNKEKDELIKVPCRKCLDCIKKRANDWTVKLIAESRYWKEGIFVTLTFDNKILIPGNKYGADLSFIYSLKASAHYFTKFIKRLRKRTGKDIVYYHVAEVGERTHRPHHHVIIFGWQPEKQVECEISKSGHIQYMDDFLTELWAAGRVTYQLVNSNNIAYVAQYSNKKIELKQKAHEPYFTFSNRAKMNNKQVQRTRNMFVRGFIEEDNKKYAIPKSYIDYAKKKMYPEFINYEYNLMEKSAKTKDEYETLLNLKKMKENVMRLRQKKKVRDII